MCEPRVWNKIYVSEVISTPKEVTMIIHAERSDYEIFNVVAKIPTDDSTLSIVNRIKKGIEILEGYRNCDCTIKSGPCIKHVTKMEFDNIKLPIQAKSKTNFKFGRG